MEAFIGILVLFASAIAGIAGIVIPIVLVFSWQNKQRNRRLQVWAQVAHELGLQFGARRIYGRRYGHPVQVSTVTRGSGNNRTTYTVVSGRLETPLDLGLSVQRHGLLNDLFTGGHDVLTGDQPFDRCFIVQADEDHRARGMLTPTLRHLLLHQLGKSGSFTCSDQGLVIERSGATSDARWLHWSIEVVSRAVHHMERAREQVPVASPLAGHRYAWATFAAARGLRGISTPLCMWGDLEGVQVVAYAVRTDTLRYCLEVRLGFDRSLGLGLLVQPQSMLDKLAVFFGSQDHKLGDPDFDNAFTVKLSDIEGAEALLDEEVRRALRGLQASMGPTTLFDEGLSVRMPYVPRDPSAVPRIVHQLTGVAELIASKRPAERQIGPYR